MREDESHYHQSHIYVISSRNSMIANLQYNSPFCYQYILPQISRRRTSKEIRVMVDSDSLPVCIMPSIRQGAIQIACCRSQLFVSLCKTTNLSWLHLKVLDATRVNCYRVCNAKFCNVAFVSTCEETPPSPPEDDHVLIRTLGQLSSSYHFTHLLLVGDFNAPKAPWTELQCVGSSGPFTAALTEVVQQSAWTQHVVAPTRYRAGQQPSLLDLVITNERHFVDQVTINAPLGHSDHCVLTFDFICYWARNPEPQTWIRNFCRRTKDVILIERVQRAATKMVAGLKSMDYETRLVVLDLFPLEYRRLRGDLILTYALFEQGLANSEKPEQSLEIIRQPVSFIQRSHANRKWGGRNQTSRLWLRANAVQKDDCRIARAGKEFLSLLWTGNGEGPVRRSNKNAYRILLSTDQVVADFSAKLVETFSDAREISFAPVIRATHKSEPERGNRTRQSGSSMNLLNVLNVSNTSTFKERRFCSSRCSHERRDVFPHEVNRAYSEPGSAAGILQGTSSVLLTFDMSEVRKIIAHCRTVLNVLVTTDEVDSLAQLADFVKVRFRTTLFTLLATYTMYGAHDQGGRQSARRANDPVTCCTASSGYRAIEKAYADTHFVVETAYQCLSERSPLPAFDACGIEVFPGRSLTDTLGQPGSIPALVLPSGGMAARHRKVLQHADQPIDVVDKFVCRTDQPTDPATLTVVALECCNDPAGHWLELRSTSVFTAYASATMSKPISKLNDRAGTWEWKTMKYDLAF
ncbi:vinculin [Clonorchis sinensis]|uniref:Vinculin n=1 Tax=Clonorchis sinensis TaxID=79923 RepID=G7YI29_CLOSI|nr:vinculin [Clonorchis sinensis]